MTYEVLPVGDDQWSIVAWLWQDFRHDLGAVVNGFPLPDGRYRHEWLDAYPGPDRCGYLAWAPHPNTGELAPVGFVLDVIGRHPGSWVVPFQHDNAAARAFWPRVAGAAWGSEWVETIEAVPGRADVAPDHWIRSL